MLVPKFRGNIKQGKLIITDTRLKEYLLTLEGDVSVKIEKWKKDRTGEQNRLLWAYYEIICNETGDNVGDFHEVAKRTLLPPRFVKIKDKNYKLPASTAKLSTKEFTEYLEKLCAWTGIPLPNIDQL